MRRTPPSHKPVTLTSLSHILFSLFPLTLQTPSAVYKRYKLSEEKTFASFFHPDKKAILGLVDQFILKEGKFGIPGYPQKLVGGWGPRLSCSTAFFNDM